MPYVSFIHRDEAGFGVSFPDFPGCVSVGDTVDDAVRRGSEALAFHVEGMVNDGEPLPAPRSIDAIRADPDLAGWREGADIVLIQLRLPASLNTAAFFNSRRGEEDVPAALRTLRRDGGQPPDLDDTLPADLR